MVLNAWKLSTMGQRQVDPTSIPKKNCSSFHGWATLLPRSVRCDPAMMCLNLGSLSHNYLFDGKGAKDFNKT